MLLSSLRNAFDHVGLWLIVSICPIEIDVLFRVTDRLRDLFETF